MPKLKELREKQPKLIAEARSALDSITPDTSEARAAELEAQHDKAMAEYDELDKRCVQLERIEAEEKRMSETITIAPTNEDREIRPVSDDVITHEQAFNRFLRSGLGEMSAAEQKVLREHRAQAAGTDSAGGYTVPQGFIARLVESMALTGPMLDPTVTDVLRTNDGIDLPMPTVDETAQEGELIAENAQVAEQDASFGQKTLEAYLYSSKVVRVSEVLLQDSGIDIEGYLAKALGDRLGRIGNRHLTVGTGSSQPNGIVTASGAGVTAAATAAITFDELIDLQHSIDPLYRRAGNTVFMFNDDTLKTMRKIKDGDGNYLWQGPDARTGAPATLLGDTYEVNNHMADIGAGNVPVIYGDFSKYIVRLVNQFPLKRLVERYADYGQVGFLAFARWDGELTDASAVKKLTNAAS